MQENAETLNHNKKKEMVIEDKQMNHNVAFTNWEGLISFKTGLFYTTAECP